VLIAPEELTVVVVDWNLPELTVRCVRSLVEDGVPAHRIVVVENGPTDANWTRIASELADCVLVRVDANVGFAVANNIGARTLPGRAYLLVNNDAFVHRAGSVAVLEHWLTRRSGVGIVVPRLLNEDLTLQSSVAPFTVPLVALARASGLSRLVPNRWQPRVSTHWDHASSRAVEAAIGAVMLVAGEVWDDLDGFVESGFMYAEDLDLCWRAGKQGWKTWFAADAEFVHLGGTSADRRWTTAERSERVGLAEAEMIRGHLGPLRAAAALAFIRVGLAARVVYFRATQNQDAAESCRGFLLGMKKEFDGSATSELAPAPAIRVVRPSAESTDAQVSQAPRDMNA